MKTKFNIEQIRRDIPRRSNCRTCGHPTEVILDFGHLPLAGAFLPLDATQEYVYPMEVCFCPECTLVQIPNQIPKEELFNEEYHYFSSVTTTLKNHFAEYAAFLQELTQPYKQPVVLEFGCNDGVLLQELRLLGVTARGIDASANVVEAGRQRGLDITCGFFGPDTTEHMASTGFKATVVTGSNVFAHNDDVDEILKGVEIILDPEGYFIVEVHYVVDLIKQLQFDFFYHEHCNYYSLHSISHLLGRFGLQVVDVQHLELHGGSIRVISRFTNDSNTVSQAVLTMLSTEKDSGMCDGGFYEDFAIRVHQAGHNLRSYLEAARGAGKRVFGYGASGRSVTMLNYMGISSDHVDFMVDDSPLRSGHIMPGLHIPIHPRELSMIANTDICLITAWTYSMEIMQRESWYVEGNSREFAIPLPHLQVISS